MGRRSINLRWVAPCARMTFPLIGLLVATPTVGGTAADFARVIDTETQTWAAVGRAANVKFE